MNEILKKYTWQIIAGLALIIVLIVVLKKTLGSFFTQENDDDLTKQAETALKATTIKTTQLKQPAAYYTSWANRFYTAMYGWMPGFVNRFSADELTELGLLNADELKQIFKEFGVKKKENWLGLQYITNGTLIDWLKDELSGTELNKMREIWTKTGLWK